MASAQGRGRFKAKVDAVFAIIAEAATLGARCPTNAEIAERLQSEGVKVSLGSVPDMVSELAREGRIVVRLYGHMFREVVVCDGPAQGNATQAPPGRAKPFRVIQRPE